MTCDTVSWEDDVDQFIEAPAAQGEPASCEGDRFLDCRPLPGESPKRGVAHVRGARPPGPGQHHRIRTHLVAEEELVMLHHSHPDAHKALQALRRELEPEESGRKRPAAGQEARRSKTSRLRGSGNSLPRDSAQPRAERKSGVGNGSVTTAGRATGPQARSPQPAPKASRPPQKVGLRPQLGWPAPTAEQRKAEQRLAFWTKQAKESAPPDLISHVDKILRARWKRLPGVPLDSVRDAIIRVIATTHSRQVPHTEVPALVRRELRKELPSETASRTAERVLKIVKPQQLLPAPESAPGVQNTPARSRERSKASVPPVESAARQGNDSTLQIAPHLAPENATLLLRILRETDLAQDFASGLAALTAVFSALHAGKQPHVTGVFLDALENRFALVVSADALRESREGFGHPYAALKDVQGLPTTKGLVITDRGSRLSAWRMDNVSAECATIEINAISSYLSRGRLPGMRYEVAGRRDGTPGAGLRDLAGFAMNLRLRESRLRPLTVDGSGNTSREWTGKQLRRLGHKNPHRVREHLRLVHTTGERTVVSEHARYAVPGWTDTTLRVRLL